MHTKIEVKHQMDRKKLALLVGIRRTLVKHFAPDTAYPGTQSSIPSAGHCAIVAAIAALEIGAGLASTSVQGVRHWINRVSDGNLFWDVDLTGDQFGLPEIQFAEAGKLYPEVRDESMTALKPETLQRALKLAQRAGLRDVIPPLMAMLRSKQDLEEIVQA